jgi:hypothetical protein
MDTFMCTGCLKRLRVASQHHVTERYSRDTSGHRRQIFQQPRQRWSVGLENAIDNAQARTPDANEHHDGS